MSEPLITVVTVHRRRVWISGSRREVAATITIWADGNTWNTGLRKIESVSAIPDNSAASEIGTTISGGTVTFFTTGEHSEENVLVRAVGN